MAGFMEGLGEAVKTTLNVTAKVVDPFGVGKKVVETLTDPGKLRHEASLIEA